MSGASFPVVDGPRVARTASWRRTLSLWLVAASGFAGLGYQIVWTQQVAVRLGHESAAVLAVVTAFFGGLAIGAFAFGPAIERSRHATRWYAACELVVGAWGAVLLMLPATFGASIVASMGDRPEPLLQWAVAFASTLVLLLPATVAMGATLPAIERATAHRDEVTRSLAPHYAANTIGAVVGVVATAFWLVPTWGLARTATVCVVLNLACAALASWCLPRHVDAFAAPIAQRRDARGALAILWWTGLLGIGYEVLVVRVLSQVTEDTVYTFALLLAVYLAGSAVGAALHRRWIARRDDDERGDERVGDRLLVLLAAACLVGSASLWASGAIRDRLLDLFGASLGAALSAEATLACVAFAVPTIAMGLVFSHFSSRAARHGASFGRALAFNTLGAACAPLLFGVAIVPSFGPKAGLLLITIGYLALTSRRNWRRPVAWIPALAVAVIVAVVAVIAPPLAFVDVPDGGHVVSYRDGVMASVSVVEDRYGVLRLHIDNREQEGSSATRFVDGRQALLPLLLHPAPGRALFLGLGTGVTSSVAAEDASLAVDAVELLPEVIDASRRFTQRSDPALGSRVHLIAGDARRFVRATPIRYDVIVSDNFHPARSGSAALYTVEHFAAVRERLAPHGVFCQWLPLHQLDLWTLRSIVRSFVQVYPDASAILASNSLETPVIGLVAHRDPEAFDAPSIRDRVARGIPQDAARFGVEDDLALLGAFIAGPRALARFAEDAPANTDDHPVVAYLAPRATYAPEALPRERLTTLLASLSVAPREIVGDTAGESFDGRLAAYWSARDRFIAAGQRVRPSTDVVAMLAQVRAPLLDVLQASPDFRPAYDPLVRMAGALVPIDADAARWLLDELVRVQPQRAEARQALAALVASPHRIETP